MSSLGRITWHYTLEKLLFAFLEGQVAAMMSNSRLQDGALVTDGRYGAFIYVLNKAYSKNIFWINQ